MTGKAPKEFAEIEKTIGLNSASNKEIAFWFIYNLAELPRPIIILSYELIKALMSKFSYKSDIKEVKD